MPLQRYPQRHGFRPEPRQLEKPTEKTTKTGKAEKVAEQPAGTVADESKKAA